MSNEILIKDYLRETKHYPYIDLKVISDEGLNDFKKLSKLKVEDIVNDYEKITKECVKYFLSDSKREKTLWHAFMNFTKYYVLTKKQILSSSTRKGFKEHIEEMISLGFLKEKRVYEYNLESGLEHYKVLCLNTEFIEVLFEVEYCYEEEYTFDDMMIPYYIRAHDVMLYIRKKTYGLTDSLNIEDQWFYCEEQDTFSYYFDIGRLCEDPFVLRILSLNADQNSNEMTTELLKKSLEEYVSNEKIISIIYTNNYYDSFKIINNLEHEKVKDLDIVFISPESLNKRGLQGYKLKIGKGSGKFYDISHFDRIISFDLLKYVINHFVKWG